MNVVGLITEYNPFHNGHLYHMEEAKRITNADFVVVVMSGNFVQRGAPALIDKYARTKMALLNGADLVLELPVCYATSSAEAFARGAITILDKLGIVNSICFGSECGDISPLSTIAQIMVDEPDQYKHHLQTYLKKGETFPTARMHALFDYNKTNPILRKNNGDISLNAVNNNDYDLSNLLSSSNNILGIEYLKALYQRNSKIRPYTLQRIEANYNDEDLTENISSATSIRKSIQRNDTLEFFKKNVPTNVFTILNEQYKLSHPIFEDDFSQLLSYQLMQQTPDSLLEFVDISDGLHMRMNNFKNIYKKYTEFALELKTKQYTLTRINRACLHLLLNIKKENMELYKKNDSIFYARILGFKKSNSILIQEAKAKGDIPIVTKMADAKYQLSQIGFMMLNEDIFSSHLFNLVVFNKYGTIIDNEYIHPIVIL